MKVKSPEIGGNAIIKTELFLQSWNLSWDKFHIEVLHSYLPLLNSLKITLLTIVCVCEKPVYVIIIIELYYEAILLQTYW